MLMKLSKEELKKVDKYAIIISLSFSMIIALSNLLIWNKDIKNTVILILAIVECISILIYMPMRLKRVDYDLKVEEEEAIKARKELEEIERLNKLKKEIIEEIKQTKVDDFKKFLPLTLKVFKSNIDDVIEYYRDMLEYMGYFLSEDDDDVKALLKSTKILMGVQNQITAFGFDEIYLILLSFLCHFDYKDKNLMSDLEELINQILEIME